MVRLLSDNYNYLLKVLGPR